MLCPLASDSPPLPPEPHTRKPQQQPSPWALSSVRPALTLEKTFLSGLYYHFTSESSFLATLWLSVCAFISTPWARCQEPGHAWFSYHFNTRGHLEATWELAVLNYCLALPPNKEFSFRLFCTDVERSWWLRNKRRGREGWCPQEGSIWLESSDFRNGSGSALLQ